MHIRVRERLDEPMIARQIGEWLFTRCGEDAALVDQILMTFRSEYAKARALIDGFCLNEPR